MNTKTFTIGIKYFITLLAICIISFYACKKHSSNDSMACRSSLNLTEEKNLSSVFSSYEIIRLETTDESLIGRSINKKIKANNKYYISFDNITLLVFDSQGKFLHKINKIGNGPGEYTRLCDFDVLPNGKIIIQDVRKLIFYSNTGEFFKAIPLNITCFNLKVIDEDKFLICASGEEYSIYLINGNGDILSKQLESNNRMVLGKNVAFFAFGSNQIVYQQDLSNDFLSFNTKTNDFSNINLFCREDKVLSIEKLNEYPNRRDYEKDNPNVKVIAGFASYTDYMFLAVGNQNLFECYLMNTSGNTIDYLLTERTVDDISFTGALNLLNFIGSDSKDNFITTIWPYEIVEGLNENIQFKEHPNYQRIKSLFKDVEDIENENPVLIELKVK